MGWGGLLDRVTSWLPIQTKVERWRNQLEKYEKEKNELLHKKATFESANRVQYLNERISELNRLLKNAAKS